MRKVISEANTSASNGFSMPAPVGGWNARDSLAMMPKADAIYLDNWFPQPTSVDIRKGSVLFGTLPAGEVIKSLLNVAKEDGTSLRFAACQHGVYDITDPNSISLTPDYALTDGRVESVNFSVGGKAWLWGCNGVDKAFAYKTESSAFITLDGASTPALTGITSTNVTNVSIWKYRLILCEKDSLSFWYLPLNSVGGAATKFDLGAVFKLGGYIVATGNWTMDAGNGPDDRFVAITSEGEVAVYQGTDPSALATFSLVGVYTLGRPVGKRCFVKLASDLAVLTEQGLWPLSKALESSTINRQASFTNKIQDAFNEYYRAYSGYFGWGAVLYSAGPALIVNVPITDTVSYQFVMNLKNGSWCRFKAWDAQCMMASDGDLLFAMGNKVYRGWVGTDDRGAAIVATGKQAFTYGTSRSRLKHVKLVRPVMNSNFSTLKYQLGLDSDFSNRIPTSSDVNFSASGYVWDAAVFDQAYWESGEGVNILNWSTVSHTPGKAWALRMRIAVLGREVAWAATDYIVETGGLLG